MTHKMFAAALASAWVGTPAIAQRTGSIVGWGGWPGVGNIPAPNAGFVAVAPGVDHTLGLKADGSIVAWGSNDRGQCNVPTPNTGFVAVAAGFPYSLGLKVDGSIVAWGMSAHAYFCNAPAPKAGFAVIAATGGYVLNLGNMTQALGIRNDGSIEG
jgi:alpha-tubulin suppressor-like RCC1 family protein